MTETFITKALDNHRSFGGKIYTSDFDYFPSWSNEKRGSYVARRIANDMKFDDDCKRNIEGRKRKRDKEIK